MRARCVSVLLVGVVVCLAGRAWAVDPFTIVALPDTQAYSADQPEVFQAESQWILDNLQRQRIVVQVR